MYNLYLQIENILRQHLLAVVLIYFGFRALDYIYSKIYYAIELARKKRFQIKSIKVTKRYSTVPDIDTTILDIQKQERETNDPTTIDRKD